MSDNLDAITECEKLDGFLLAYYPEPHPFWGAYARRTDIMKNNYGVQFSAQGRTPFEAATNLLLEAQKIAKVDEPRIHQRSDCPCDLCKAEIRASRTWEELKTAEGMLSRYLSVLQAAAQKTSLLVGSDVIDAVPLLERELGSAKEKIQELLTTQQVLVDDLKDAEKCLKDIVHAARKYDGCD